ncbi:hypothetical protein JK636_12605 [Clostridium sp. YIM B02515]|uniref:Uncharacterized protein n=1 Tax=Clostridium rhizosphaerae TaxID=2803861 RepID=A0ABS1TB72_9CLOT|nr:hypothetical protein [Clostridium rhizosphaerae]MBL4936599.1 hypothetical protein [Clostridium rhizosphaerae]
MNEEKDITTNENVQSNNIDIDKKDTETVDTISDVSAENDVSTVKVRTILKQRFRKLRPSVKMAIPIILVGIICFVGGIMADRALMWNRAGKFLKGRPGISRQMKKDPFNNKQFKNKNNTLPNKNNNNNNGGTNSQNNG